MASKLQLYNDVSDHVASDVTAKRGNWMSFLDTAARLYKYPFPDQLLIHAQRPDAIACAPIETWNESFNRWVRRGSKGIALIDDTGSYPRLRYVFDISDTEPSAYNARPVYLWEMLPEHKTPVLEALSKTYDDVGGSLADSFRSIAKQLAREYYEDNAQEIRYRSEFSFLGEFDDFNLGTVFEDALTDSITYMLLSRCGFDAADYFAGDADFHAVLDFNTQDMVYALGTAASELSQQVLRDIESVIKKYERQRAVSPNLAAERSGTNEQTDDLHAGRGLSSAGHHSERTGGELAGPGAGTPANREIREDAEDVSERPQDDNVQLDASERDAVPTPAGDRRGSGAEDGTGDGRTNSEEPDTRQGGGPDGVDSGDELAESDSGGNHTPRTGLQLEQDDGAAEAAPLSMAELAHLHSDWNELLKNDVLNDESVMEAAVNGDKENTLSEIETAIKRFRSDMSSQILASDTVQNKLGHMTELDLFLFKERKPTLVEQLYDVVIRLDIYAEILEETAADAQDERYSQVGNTSIEELLKGSSITAQEVDAILRDGGNFDNHYLFDCPFHSRSALRIAAHFAKGLDDNAAYLKREYITGRYEREYIESGKGFSFGNRHVCAWFGQDGISLAVGVTAKNNIHRVTIPWEAAAARVDELMREGQYISRPDFDNAVENEKLELAGRLWHFYRDDMHDIPDDFSAEHGGYPGDAALIKSLLDDDNERRRIRDRLETDVTAWKNNPERRSWNNPFRVLEEMNSAIIPHTILPSDSFSYDKPHTYFITQDEVDAFLTRGSSYSESKFRFISFFLGDHDTKEKVAFLKREYGHGGGTHSQTDGWCNAEPGKGINIQRGKIGDPDAEVTLKWPAVIKRIEQLLADGRYVSRAELDRIPDYERIELVRQITGFYHNLPDEYEHPFPGKSDYFGYEYRDENNETILNFLYPREAEWQAIRDLLDNPERVDALLGEMQRIFENTPEEDRYYDSRKSGYENLLAYREGTYTLFPGIEKLPDPELAEVRVRSTVSAVPTLDPAPTQIVEQFSLFGENNPSLIAQTSLPVLPSVEEQRAKIEQVNEQTAGVETPAADLFDELDAAILDVSNADKMRLAAQFAESPRSREAVRLYREIYNGTLDVPPYRGMKRIAELVEDGRFDVAEPLEQSDAAEPADPGKPLYKVGDTVYLEGGKAFNITKISDFGEVQLQDPSLYYPIFRSESKESFERLLSMFSGNEQYLAPVIAHAPDTPAAVAEIAEEQPAKLDFDDVEQTVYKRVMADPDYVDALLNAQSRGVLRNPLNTALEKITREFEQDGPQAYLSFFSDDDFNDRLFDYIYRESWEQRPLTPERAQAITYKLVDKMRGGELNYDDVYTAAFELKLTLSEFGDQDPENHYGGAAYVTWNATGNRNDDSTLRLDYNFGEDGHAGKAVNIEIDFNAFGIEAPEPTPAEQAHEEHVKELTDKAVTQFRETWADVLDNAPPVAPKPRYEAKPIGSVREVLSGHPAFDRITDTDAIYGVWDTENNDWVRNGDGHVDFSSEMGAGADADQLNAEAEWALEAPVPEASVPVAEHPSPVLQDADGFTEITDPDELAELAGIFGNSDAEQPASELVWEQIEGGEVTNVRIDLTQPVHEQRTPVQEQRNFRITDEHLGEGGAKTKFRYNVEAINTLRGIELEKRSAATPEEQEKLARYVGWGGLPQAFDPDNKQWEKEYLELNAMLSPDEFESARASTLNAHYTSPTVIKAIYEAVERLGFKTGNILEPACGVGNFFGLLPDSMQKSKLYGVELDGITARIAKLLYPKADIRETGFEKTDMPDAFFDLAIGNVPFGDYGVVDKRYDKHHFKIHDYFFAKSLDQVRPGGIVAFITSKGTLDKTNSKVRKYIAQRAELLGAVRLPNTAFLKNAGTEVTSDIIFLQKRDRPIDIEPDWVHLGMTEDGIPVNRYYADNPEMVLGTMAKSESNRMYGNEDTTTCIPFEGADLAEQLKTALSFVEGEYTVAELDDIDGIDNHAIPADTHVKNFSYALITPTEPDEDGNVFAGVIGNGRVYFRENSLMYPVELPATTLERIKGMIALRDCVHKLIELQLDEYSDADIKEQQERLNELYDSFTAEYGLINSTANNRAFSADSAYYLLCSLEILDEDGRLERKADMFTKRTIKQKVSITHVDTASEALAVSIGERACVDLEYMQNLTGFSQEKLVSDLKGIIFLNIGYAKNQRETYVTADEYLSGNIREKLMQARAAQAAISDGSLDLNISRLEAAMPKDLEASEISVRLGSTWVDAEYIQQFLHELLGTTRWNRDVYKVNYFPINGEWQVTNRGRAQYSDVAATVTYGTSRANAYEIIHDTLNLRDVRVYDYKEDADGKEKRVLNKKETMLAQQKQEQIKQAFKDWIWKDPERRQMLVKKYNEMFNSVRPREYDGNHIQFVGANPEILFKEHQINAVARQMYGGNTLLAHVVGAGKTFEMIAAAMESKRLGLCHKSLFAVPNHLTEQWAAEFLRLYPHANILVATKKDFEMRNRKKFCAKIATGEYDAVIIGHTQLEKIPMSFERQQRLINEQIWEIEDGIRSLTASKAERYTIKQFEKTKKSLETRLSKLIEGKTRDDVVTFEQLGVDRLFVDEAHNFKNLFLYTKMRNVAGLSTSEAQKSSDLFMKCRYMDEITGNKGVIFATGTPISNSMTEMYTMQRYLQYDALIAKRLTHFDCWASTFGETQTSIELAPEGSGYRARTRFSKFHNLPELMCMFKEVADVQTADMLNLPVPEAKFETVVVEPSDMQKEMVQELSERAAAVQAQRVDPSIDNMLKITTDGRKIGLDQRLINPLLPDFEGSKVNACANKVFNIWEETKNDRLSQLVFCDFSTPRKKSDISLKKNDDGVWEADMANFFENVYQDIKFKLLDKGIPEHEIAFIHDADTEVKKKELFAKVRQGKVRIMFGSTFKMGAGTNVQDRLIHSHDLDCPWRPADLEQRAGRIVRQGNQNPEVGITRYVTNATFDSYLYQTLENKQKVRPDRA